MAHDLAPCGILDKAVVKGIVAAGGPTSMRPIMARTLEIPAVMGRILKALQMAIRQSFLVRMVSWKSIHLMRIDEYKSSVKAQEELKRLRESLILKLLPLMVIMS